MYPSLVPFQSEMLPDAGALLAERHRQERLVFPALPERFEDAAAARVAVEALWNKEFTSGVAAVIDGRMVAYLIGSQLFSQQWGRCAWIRLAGCAVAPDQSLEILRDMYAAIAARWVAQGCFFHFAVMPTANPALLHTWHSLSFGIEQVEGLLSLTEPLPPPSRNYPDISIRIAESGDREIIAGMYSIIRRHLAGPPVWGISLPETEAEVRQGFAELLDEPGAITWLAFRKGEAVGLHTQIPLPPADDDLLIPDRCNELQVGATVLSALGQGVGSTLMQAALAHIREQGVTACQTDWRSANLQADRFWRSRGFRPVAYRLVRRIDSRIAWGHARLEDWEPA